MNFAPAEEQWMEFMKRRDAGPDPASWRSGGRDMAAAVAAV